MSEYIIHYKDAETLYEHKDFPFPLEEYLCEEIVRCRDCKYYNPSDAGCMYWVMASNKLLHVNAPDGFCAWGERKENGR